MTTPTHHSPRRVEFKYVIPVDLRDRLLGELVPYVGADRHGGADGTYRVNTLYYDSPDLQCYFDKIQGFDRRRKLRVRRYGPPRAEAEAQPLWIEIKQRIGQTIGKRRFFITLDRFNQMMRSGDLGEFASTGNGRRALAEEMLALVTLHQLRPVLTVRYLRLAFVGRFERGLRITFDSGVRCAEHFGEPTRCGHGRYMLPPHLCIMEAKINDASSRWLNNLMARHNLTHQRYSKYCAAVERLNLLDWKGLSKWTHGSMN